MRAIFFSLLFLITTSFFWSDDEEKQLRQLHQNGEAAMLKEDYEEAKTCFEELIHRVSINSPKKYSVDWQTYVDLVIRLASAYEELGDKKEAVQTIDTLFLKNPPKDFIPQVMLAKTRLLAGETAPEESYLQMSKIANSLSQDGWSPKTLSFFHALEFSLNAKYDDMLQKAKRYLTTGFYQEAIEAYKAILLAIQEGSYPKASRKDSLIAKKVRYRLAEAHYLALEYEKSLALCEQSPPEDQIDQEMLYLAALCFRKKNEFEKALSLFQTYLEMGEKHLRSSFELAHYEEAVFEIGYFDYQHGNLQKAKESFKKLQSRTTKPGTVASIYLARIALENAAYDEVFPILNPLVKRLNQEDPAKAESEFLLGTAAYSLEKYEAAKIHLEKSLRFKGSQKWHVNAWYQLGWSYFHLIENPDLSENAKNQLLAQAQEVFEKLLLYDQESASIALAQLFIFQTKILNQKIHSKKIFEILENRERFSLEGQAYANLLLAAASDSFFEKEAYLSQATEKKFSSTQLYAQAWYQKGLLYFEARGIKNDSTLLKKAIYAFEEAFRLFEQQDVKKAAQILKFEAKASFFQQAPLKSLALLEKLLSQFEETSEEREETLYLQGLIASGLKESKFLEMAERALLQVISNTCHRSYTPDALHVLGALYFKNENYLKAKERFLQLAKVYPESPHAPSAWFWAAEAAEKAGENPFDLRAKVYELYPEHELAAEAYFRQYTYTDYLEKRNEAIKHLQSFVTLFPNSFLGVFVHYLNGLCEESFEKSSFHFQQALDVFENYLQNTANPDRSYASIHYQTRLELANRIFQNEKKKAEEMFAAIIADFSEKGHPLTSLLKERTSYPSVYEEAEFRVAQCYLAKNQESKAQKQLTQMISHYHEAGITAGFFLSQVWQELGKLAMQCGDFQTALNCLESADECGKGYLSDEQTLSIWIEQSNCYRGKKEYDQAMRFLSKVINAQTPSPLRLQAMILRAEIYELEGRPEFAIRQLEAAAKKGGEWAHEAEEKLRRQYGVQ